MGTITQIFILIIGVAAVRCHSLPQFDHPGLPGPPPYRNIFTDFVHNLANGFLGGLFGHGNGIRPGGYNFQPNSRPGYGEYYGNGVNNVGVPIPGPSFGVNDHNIIGPQPGGLNGIDNSYNTGTPGPIGQGGNNEKLPEKNIAASNIPQKPDIQGEKDNGDKSVNNYFIVVPLNPNEIKPHPEGESNSNANGASVNDVHNNAGGENVNINVNSNAIVDAQEPNLQNNPEQQKEDANKELSIDSELKYNTNIPQEPKVSNQIEGNENNQEQIKLEPIGNEMLVPGFGDEKSTLMVDPEVKYNTNIPEERKLTPPDNVDATENKVPGFNDDDIKNGISMTNPELKHSGTDELEKFRNPDAIVFPNEGTQIIIENLPNRFSNAENNNKPSNNVQVTQPTSTSNNEGIQNQNQNQQVPPNNVNAPYVNEPGNSNGVYTVVNTPSSTESSGPSNANAGVSSTGQNNGPYVNLVGSPSEYTVMNVPNNAGNSGQGYIVPGNANSGANNPPVVYVMSNGNSGVHNPGYVTANYGTNYPSPSYGYNDMNKPTQVYIPINGNAGGNPNQMYVVANPGSYNLGQNGQSTPRPLYVTIPTSGAQATTGGYYKPIFVPTTNGHVTVPVNYKPVVTVPVGPGYQVVGNNPGVVVSYQTPGNVMTSGGNAPPLNVPLLISYKDDESDEGEKKKAGQKKAKQSIAEDRYTGESQYHDNDVSHQNMEETMEH